ncbi:hypothetical protein HRU45_03630 [Candidatus Dependentiae bacterium]|nr:hypothetical protein [Candidatus Dependentiae bacterium]
MKTAFSTKSALFLSLTLLASTGLFAGEVKPVEKNDTVASTATNKKNAQNNNESNGTENDGEGQQKPAPEKEPALTDVEREAKIQAATDKLAALDKQREETVKERDALTVGFWKNTKLFFNNRREEIVKTKLMALFAVFSVLHLGRYGYNFLFEEDEIDVRRSRCRTE